MKKIFTFAIIIISSTLTLLAQTTLRPSDEVFASNRKENVWLIQYKGKIVGEWWPVNGLKLVTNKSHPNDFYSPQQKTPPSLKQILIQDGYYAIAPDGTSIAGISSPYQLEGDCIIEGKRYRSSKPFPDVGIVTLYNNGNVIEFSHKREYRNIDQHLQSLVGNNSASLFFLPVIKREHRMIDSPNSIVDRALVRREGSDRATGRKGIEQIGVVVFYEMSNYSELIDIMDGLDRPGESKTTHIYFLDGGPTWGQVARKTEVNDKTTVQEIGTRDPRVPTNYLLIY